MWRWPPVREDELMIRVIVAVQGQEQQYLQALYPVPVRIADLADSVEFAFVRYQEMNFLRNSLKMTFSLALSSGVVNESIGGDLGRFYQYPQYHCAGKRAR